MTRASNAQLAAAGLAGFATRRFWRRIGGSVLEHNQDSEARALADRLVNYSDALVALVFIGASGLGIAVADPDTRSSIALINYWMIGGNVVIGVLFSVLLVVLRRWELDLRVDLPTVSNVRRYSRHLYRARHTVVWLSVAQIVLIMLLISSN